jgi:hypothetical protein
MSHGQSPLGDLKKVMELMRQLKSRYTRKICAWLLLVTLLLPTMLSIAPTPALSAEQQLIFEITQHVCSQNPSQHSPHQKQVHESCCILCAFQNFLFASDFGIISISKWPENSSAINPVYFSELFTRAPPDVRATPPQGPPSSI